jgi:hypothetical protein
MAQRIIAISTKSFNSSGDLKWRTNYIATRLSPDDTTILYDEVDDLVTQVGTLLTKKKDCLGMLEIWAHANPLVCNQLTNGNVNAWVQELMKIVWCDNAFLYLSGCNTGNMEIGPGWALKSVQQVGPIARALAEAMPYDSSHFPIHLAIFGTRGYSRGAHIINTITCEKSLSEGHLWWYRFYPPYGNSIDASGAQVWQQFNNW